MFLWGESLSVKLTTVVSVLCFVITFEEFLRVQWRLGFGVTVFTCLASKLFETCQFGCNKTQHRHPKSEQKDSLCKVKEVKSSSQNCVRKNLLIQFNLVVTKNLSVNVENL